MKANRYIAKFIKVLDDLDKSGKHIPGLILSHAGFGKTSSIRMYCDWADYNLETIIPAQNSADDILGLQSLDQATGKMVRKTPSWFNKLEKTMENGKRTILFIDEISTCDPYIQGPLLNLIFSRSLGEATLPDNVFIVSAANYSTDLNSEFGLTAPLVNRFMLLNLMEEDFNVSELLDDFDSNSSSLTFSRVSTKKEMEKFLDITPDTTPCYSFQKFTEWINDSKEIGFGRTNIEETDEGLWGFTSVRSLSYSLAFTQAYMNTYNDDLWVRIVGHTLGTSKKKEGISLYKCLKGVFSSFKDEKASSAMTSNTIADIANYILKTGRLEPDVIAKLKKVVENTESTDFTSADIRSFSNVASKYTSNKSITEINRLFIDKINDSYA